MNSTRERLYDAAALAARRVMNLVEPHKFEQAEPHYKALLSEFYSGRLHPGTIDFPRVLDALVALSGCMGCYPACPHPTAELAGAIAELRWLEDAEGLLCNS